MGVPPINKNKGVTEGRKGEAVVDGVEYCCCAPPPEVSDCTGLVVELPDPTPFPPTPLENEDEGVRLPPPPPPPPVEEVVDGVTVELPPAPFPKGENEEDAEVEAPPLPLPIKGEPLLLGVEDRLPPPAPPRIRD